MSRAGQEIDLDSLLPFMLNKVVRVMNASLEQALQEHGLSVAEWRVLATLACTPVDRPSGISEFTGIELSTLSRTFDRLEKQGFVKRIKLPESGRAYAINLTKPGRRTLQAAATVMWEQHDRLLSRLNKNEAAALLRVVKSLYRAMGRPPELRDGGTGKERESA